MIIFANDDYVVFFDHLHLIEIYHFDHVCAIKLSLGCSVKMSTQNRRRQTFVIQNFSWCCLLLLLFGGKRQCLSK